MGKLLEGLSIFVICLLLASVLLAGIYYFSSWLPSVGALIFALSIVIILSAFHLDTSGSDPAGAGMAAGFKTLIDIVISIIVTIVYYILLKNGDRETVLNYCTILTAVGFLIASIFVSYDIVKNG